MAATVMQTWGRRIFNERVSKGITQQRLADMVGVDQSVVSYWEHGHKAPSVERQLAIARALQISPRNLFEFPEAVA